MNHVRDAGVRFAGPTNLTRHVGNVLQMAKFRNKQMVRGRSIAKRTRLDQAPS